MQTGRPRTAFGVTMRPKKVILCLDHNEQSLSILKFTLETRGYLVVNCSNSRDALTTFRKGGVDMVLADLGMGENDGAEFVRHIKAVSPETPAILVSGKVKIYDKDLQCDVFLGKGMYTPTELIERIRVLLVRKRGPRKPMQPAVADRHLVAAS